ncbi:MAG TPA: arylsulfatase [Verrucomicrobiae bacterium]|nr:arylsulfatase [Verrucomicrobiae bacterium]
MSHRMTCPMLGRALPIALLAILAGIGNAATKRPNVIILLTDDQGYGDLSCHGNPILRTPNLDRLHAESIRLVDFHVTPMCTPTRGQIMTGRSCLSTGAYVVCSGRSFIREGIPTMPEIFAGGGYRTGIFGKWHLGDYYPYRPQDRGFQEVLTFGGWGVGCAQDHWNNAYQDCWFLHNGKAQFYPGYCTDVWFAEAMKWMKARAAAGEPFLCYLPTNTPHGPNWVPPQYAKPYAGKVPPGVAKFFGMIGNLDDNVGRLETMLAESGLRENTILIYMTDNGGTGGVKTFNAGMRGHKTEYYDGGHRVPFFLRWPAGGLRPAGDVPDLAQCQDLLPTLMELCGVERPSGFFCDGTTLAPLLKGQPQPGLRERMLVVQYGIWEEWEGPVKWNSAVLWNKWRLVKGEELYDIASDPAQATNIASQKPDVVAQLREHYEKWWSAIEPSVREFVPIHLGSEHEDPVCLGSQDWAGYNTSNTPDIRAGVNRNGPWHVLVERAGEYEFSLRRWPVEADAAITATVPAYQGALGSYAEGKALPIARAQLRVGDFDATKPVGPEDKATVFTAKLPVGRTLVQTSFRDAADKEICGAYYVYVHRK